MARRNKLADAHQREREIKNRIHAYDQGTVLPLRAQLAALEGENKRLKEQNSRLKRLERLYKDCWEAAVRLSSALLASGKDD